VKTFNQRERIDRRRYKALRIGRRVKTNGKDRRKIEELKTTFTKIRRATAIVRPRLVARGATHIEIQEAQARLRGDAIDKFLDHLNSWIHSRGQKEARR
jgi:hypothetical protein